MRKADATNAGLQYPPVTFKRAEDSDLEEIARLVQDVFAGKKAAIYSNGCRRSQTAPRGPKPGLPKPKGTIVRAGLTVQDWSTDFWIKPQFGAGLFDRGL
jgi:hypothetical protein